MGARSGGAWASNRGSNGFTINFTNYKTGRHQSIQTKAKSMAGAQKAASRIEKISKGNLKWFSIEKNKPATGGAKSTPKAAAPKKSGGRSKIMGSKAGAAVAKSGGYSVVNRILQGK